MSLISNIALGSWSDPLSSKFEKKRQNWFGIHNHTTVFFESLISNMASNFWSDPDLGPKVHVRPLQMGYVHFTEKTEQGIGIEIFGSPISKIQLDFGSSLILGINLFGNLIRCLIWFKFMRGVSRKQEKSSAFFEWEELYPFIKSMISQLFHFFRNEKHVLSLCNKRSHNARALT